MEHYICQITSLLASNYQLIGNHREKLRFYSCNKKHLTGCREVGREIDPSSQALLL